MIFIYIVKWILIPKTSQLICYLILHITIIIKIRSERRKRYIYSIISSPYKYSLCVFYFVSQIVVITWQKLWLVIHYNLILYANGKQS